LDANQVPFTPIQQLPLDLIAGVEADGGGQGQGKTHVKAGFLSPKSKWLGLSTDKWSAAFFELSSK
jgi:hypothetical protein